MLYDLVGLGFHTAGSSSRTGSFDGSVTLTDAQEELLFNNALYVNIHSDNAQSGEIRGSN
ncbi:MAG: CHRD domain-containing protein [Pirellulaceae bacterium]